MNTAICEVDIRSDCKDMQEAARKLLFAIATVRAGGGRLLKLLHTEGQRQGLRRHLRAWREEHLISVFAASSELSDGGVTEEYLSAMYPALRSDADFAARAENVIFLAI